MTQFKTPNLGSAPYIPGQKAVTGYDPMEQFEKDFNTQVSRRVEKLFQEQLKARHGVKFVDELPDGAANELVFNFNWQVAAVSELNSVSHHVVIHALADAPFLIRDALLNLTVTLPRDKIYEVKVLCSKAHFDEPIYMGQILLFAADEELEYEHPEPEEVVEPVSKKRWGLKAPVVEPT